MMPAETPAWRAMRITVVSAKPTSSIAAMVALINCWRRIGSIPTFGTTFS
nr:hypothetical protein [Halomonas sp.]